MAVMIRQAEETLSIHGPAELIEAVPYLLGFHPQESLVLVGFSAHHGATGDSQLGRVEVCLRLDLPPTADNAELLSALGEPLARSAVTDVVALILTAGVRRQPRAYERFVVLTSAVMAAMAATGIEVADVLLATPNVWWSMLCEDAACCPPEGRIRQVGCSPSAARATFAGLVALPDRDAMCAELDGEASDVRAQLDGQLAQAQKRLAGAVDGAALRRLLRADSQALQRAAKQAAIAAGSMSDGAPVSKRRLARFGAALMNIAVRDELWMSIDGGELDATALLRQLHSRLPSPYDAPPLFLYGWSQWRRGNGTLAGMAAERALGSDPNYTAASLLLTAVRNGVNPNTTPLLNGEMTA